MNPRILAASIHILTASGAVLALFALLAAQNGNWQGVFVWLGLALIVDGIDGPLARRYDVKGVLPRFSGERLDLIVDYLTYVVIPAYVLTEVALLPEWSRVPAAIAILLSGLFHVSDMGSKNDEGYFVGFPAIWNVVLLYLFVLGLPPGAALILISALVLLTFVPVLYVHPFRVVRLRLLTGCVLAIWSAVAIAAIAQPFPSALWVKVVLVGCALYFLGLGLTRSLRHQR